MWRGLTPLDVFGLPRLQELQKRLGECSFRLRLSGPRVRSFADSAPQQVSKHPHSALVDSYGVAGQLAVAALSRNFRDLTSLLYDKCKIQNQVVSASEDQSDSHEASKYQSQPGRPASLDGPVDSRLGALLGP